MLYSISTIDMLQVQRSHKPISLDVCVMCSAGSKSLPHVFLDYVLADFLWNTLVFLVSVGCSLGPRTMD